MWQVISCFRDIYHPHTKFEHVYTGYHKLQKIAAFEQTPPLSLTPDFLRRHIFPVHTFSKLFGLAPSSIVFLYMYMYTRNHYRLGRLSPSKFPLLAVDYEPTWDCPLVMQVAPMLFSLAKLLAVLPEVTAVVVIINLEHNDIIRNVGAHAQDLLNIRANAPSPLLPRSRGGRIFGSLRY